MRVKYDTLAENSAVFIYPGSRKFYPSELPLIEHKLEEYTASLMQVKIDFLLKYNRFIVFVVDPSTPLDLDAQNDLVGLILEIEKEFDLTLIDKINVCFKQGDFVQVKEVKEFKRLIKNRGVSLKTIVFDSTVNTKDEFEKFWEIPAEESWLSHWF